MSALEQRLLTHVRYLSEAIGPRPAGSPACQAAADYIAANLAAAGLLVERQAYVCPAWDHRGTELSLDGTPLAASANVFSPPCDLRGPTMPLGSLAALEAAEMAGRLVVLYGELAVPLPPKAAGQRDHYGARVVAALEAGRPAAVITVQPGESMLPRLIEDPDLSIPSVTVPARAGLALLRSPGSPARLRIFSARWQGRGANVVGRLGPGAGRLLIYAHYDTKIDTPGATDNAGGVAVLLELARALGARPLARPVELVALSGGAYLPSGEAAYVGASGQTIDRLAATLSFDGVGQALGATGLALHRPTLELERLARAAAARTPEVVCPAGALNRPAPRPGLAGLPGLTVGCVGGRRLAHTRDDTAAWVSPARLVEALTVGLDLADLLEEFIPEVSRSVGLGLAA